MTSRDTRHGRYEGPPGDDREYWMPRDMAAWEASWSEHLGSKPDAPIADEQRSKGEVDMSPEAVEARRIAKQRHDEAMAYIREYTGSFGLILDIRASERWGTKYMKLSERQVEAVLASRDRDNEARLNTELWQDDEYLRWEAEQHAPERPQPSSPQDAGVEAQPTPGSATRGDVPDGWYVVDGEPWKVQWNRERTRKYAKRLEQRPGGGGGGLDRDAGHHPAAGEWVYVPGGLGIVARKGEPMTLEVAQQYGKLYGVCAICGRTLTDEKSIADGIGPVCIERVKGA
jgi:hypothetical protein